MPKEFKRTGRDEILEISEKINLVMNRSDSAGSILSFIKKIGEKHKLKDIIKARKDNSAKREYRN
jgi:hypothetical protein